MSKKLKKKLRGGPVIEIDPQILRWRALRKKLGLYKPARRVKIKEKEVEEKPVTLDIWDVFK